MQSVLSQNWYRVAGLRLKLASHVRVQRRVFRGNACYLLFDKTSARQHRVSEAAFHIVGRLSGEHTMQHIWEVATAQLRERMPSQDEIIHLLSVLHESHLIQSDAFPDVEEMFKRRDADMAAKRMASVNPLSFRLPLWNPSAFLDRWVRWVKPLFTRTFFRLWCLLVCVVGAALLPRMTELTHYGARLLDARYLLLLVLCYPVIKLLHELGHAFAVRVWGGEVREMGIAMMLVVPVPYVDASAASAFEERHRRVLVGAAGIMVELFLAALAAITWLNTQPGLLRDFAFVTMAIGGVSTLLFNGNPLLRFDGYYVLSDLLEIPNLGTRATASAQALIQRHLLGAKLQRAAETDRFERMFLPLYAVVSTGYRLAISAIVVLAVAGKSLLLALCLGLWLGSMQLVRPTLAAVRYLLRSPALAQCRARALAVALLGAVGPVLMVLTVPTPASSHTLGVVWYPEQAQIRAHTSGFVKAVHGRDADLVSEGDPVIEFESAQAQAKLVSHQARVQMLLARLRHAMQHNPADLQAATHELKAREAELADAQRKVDSLLLRAKDSGRLALPKGEDLPGRFVKQGETLGHLVTPTPLSVRVAATQEQAARIRGGVLQVSVRLRENPSVVYAARLGREVPSGENMLPSPALGDRAGGQIRTDVADTDGLRTEFAVFFFDVEIPNLRAERIGGRADVVFKHPYEPLGKQWSRALRQAFVPHG